jgi:hypothetical protein
VRHVRQHLCHALDEAFALHRVRRLKLVDVRQAFVVAAE